MPNRWDIGRRRLKSGEGIRLQQIAVEERWILDQTLQTGNLNYFTNFYFRLPNSGTMWMPDNSLGNYRNVFQY